MSHKRSGKTSDAAHRRRERRDASRSPGDHTDEKRIDESGEESFPASDPPAHAKDLPPVEGERRPEDDEEPRAEDEEERRAPDDAEGGIGGRPTGLDDAIEAGED